MVAHPLAEQLLPAVAVLGHGRVGVGFAQHHVIGRDLLVRGVDAGLGAEEVSPAPASRATTSRCVLMRTESMHSALCVSMNPMPPTSGARLWTTPDPAPAAARRRHRRDAHGGR